MTHEGIFAKQKSPKNFLLKDDFTLKNSSELSPFQLFFKLYLAEIFLKL
jgi:hypothetical protein